MFTPPPYAEQSAESEPHAAGSSRPAGSIRPRRSGGSGRAAQSSRPAHPGRTGLVMVTLVAVVFGLTGCFGPDMSDRANQIGATISTMPGVEKIDTVYQNGLDAGQTLEFTLTMAADVTEDQVAAIAEKTDAEVGSDFKRLTRTLVMNFDEFTVESNIGADIDTLRARIPRMRALASALSYRELTWEDKDVGRRGDPEELEFRDLTESGFEALSAVRDQFGSDTMEVDILGGGGPEWHVMFPYSAQAQQNLESVLDPVLWQTERINIEKDRVAAYSVNLPEGPQVTERLMGIIDLIKTGTKGSWTFSWMMDTQSQTQSNLHDGGSVSVDGCDYGGFADDSTEHMTSQAVATQEQLRDIYDSCLW